MRWTPALGQLRNLLAEYFPSYDSARPFIADVTAQANNLNLSRVQYTGSGSPELMWQAILEEAARQDAVMSIIDLAKGRFPGESAKLSEIGKEIQSEPPAPSPPAPTAVSPNDLRKFIASHFSVINNEMDDLLADLTDKLQKARKVENGQPVTITRDTLGGQTSAQVALNLIQYLQRRGWFDYLPPIVRDHRGDKYDGQFGASR